MRIQIFFNSNVKKLGPTGACCKASTLKRAKADAKTGFMCYH